MAFINSDGSAATKETGELGIENDGSAQGVLAVSLNRTPSTADRIRASGDPPDVSPGLP